MLNGKITPNARIVVPSGAKGWNTALWKEGNRVTIMWGGYYSNEITSDNIVFTLPEEYRPVISIVCPITLMNGAGRVLAINKSGVAKIQSVSLPANTYFICNATWYTI